MSEQNIKITLMVVGAGGTGTYFLKEISRYLSSTDRNKIARMVICDGDTVERKNLSRQAFDKQDIGRNKAEAMADILNEAFGLNWQFSDEYIMKKENISKLIYPLSIPVIIGCVDNHGCRIVCSNFFNDSKNCLYFDAANEFDSGECVYSARISSVTYSPVRPWYFPDMLKEDTRGRGEISCEELNNSAPQHILANMNSALSLLGAFVRFYEKGDLTLGYSVYNPFTHYSRFYSAEDCKWNPEKEDCNG